MGKYQDYPKYKESGIKWLGAIPFEWELWKLNHAFEEIGSGTTPSSTSDEWYGGNVPWVTTGELREKVIVSTNKNLTRETLRKFSTLRKYSIGSIVIAMYGATIGRLGILGVEATTNQACCVLTKSNVIDNKYLYYWLQAFKQDIVNLASGGGQPNINQEVVASLKISSPNIFGQKQIANFLDHETAKIDRLIEKQQQLIKLLKEKRQAVISHAVTKGLNPDVPMRDSGVDWLGKVPEHWFVTRLKYECIRIVDCPHSTPDYNEDGIYPAIRTADLKIGSMDVNNARRVTKEVYDSRNLRLVPISGDIIYSREGERFGIGALVPEGCNVCLAQRVMLFRIKNTPEFLMWAINSQSTYKQAQQDAIGSTSPHINVDTIKNFALAWPPEAERQKISIHVDRNTAAIDNVTTIASSKIILLKERRTALISAAVTGKIDVRNWQAPEPPTIITSEEIV